MAMVLSIRESKYAKRFRSEI